jgi:hypothetical protein
MLEITSLDPLSKHKNQHTPGLAHHHAQPILPGIITRYVKNSLLLAINFHKNQLTLFEYIINAIRDRNAFR